MILLKEKPGVVVEWNSLLKSNIIFWKRKKKPLYEVTELSVDPTWLSLDWLLVLVAVLLSAQNRT